MKKIISLLLFILLFFKSNAFADSGEGQLFSLVSFILIILAFIIFFTLIFIEGSIAANENKYLKYKIIIVNLLFVILFPLLSNYLIYFLFNKKYFSGTEKLLLFLSPLFIFGFLIYVKLIIYKSYADMLETSKKILALNIGVFLIVFVGASILTIPFGITSLNRYTEVSTAGFLIFCIAAFLAIIKQLDSALGNRKQFKKSKTTPENDDKTLDN